MHIENAVMVHNTIDKAPAKFDLSVAFFRREPARFTVQGQDFPNGSQEIEVILNHLSHEDGSGSSFCFEGYTKSDIPGMNTSGGAYIRGWFRTTNGHGWLSFEKK